MSKCEQCIVGQLNVFKELTKEEIVRISRCKTSKKVKKGEVIFEEGEHINGVYCVRDGICKVSQMSENGREQIIHLIKKGDLLGERSLVNDEVASLKATAVNDMELCFIPREEILSDLQNNRDFSMAMLKNFANSLKNTNTTVVNMAQKTVKQRLAYTLLYLYDHFGLDENEALDVHLTREDIANIIGTATESAIRILSEYKKKEIIDLKGKDIFILNKDELKNISEGF